MKEYLIKKDGDKILKNYHALLTQMIYETSCPISLC